MSDEEKYIQQLINQGENQQLDFKYEISDSRKIAKTLVAFANTDGGTLLIGVKDNGNIAGVSSDEERYMIEAAADMYSKPEIKLNIKEYQVFGKTVLEVVVQHVENVIHYAEDNSGKWLAYLRAEDQTMLMNRISLKVWQRKLSNKGVQLEYTDKEKILLNYLNENKYISLSKYSKLAAISRFVAENILVNFILIELIDIVFTDKQILYTLANQDL